MVTRRSGRAGAEGSRPRASRARTVAQRCLQGAPAGPKYGQVHVAISLIPRSRTRTLYLSVPRTRATTSPADDAVIATRPLAKYDWPRERTASLNSRATFWAIPIIASHPGRPRHPTSVRGDDPRRHSLQKQERQPRPSPPGAHAPSRPSGQPISARLRVRSDPQRSKHPEGSPGGGSFRTARRWIPFPSPAFAESQSNPKAQTIEKMR
jgi:hypothetical protein